MNRRDFLKSTAASVEPVRAPALFDHGDPKISNGTFNATLRKVTETDGPFYAERGEFDLFRIEPIADSDFIQWPPWRDK